MNKPASSHSTLRDILHNPLILPLYVPALLISISEGLLIPVLPLYAKSLQVSYGLVGLVMAGEGLGMLISDIPAGVLMRRLGKKRAMLLGIGCVVLSSAALFWARALPGILILRLVAGFGFALHNVARHAFIADTISNASRGRAVSFLGGLFRIGHFGGPMIGGKIAALCGLRATFLAFSGLCAAAWLILAVCVGATGGQARQPGTEGRSHGRLLLSTLRAHCRVLASAGAGQLFAQIIRAGRGAIIPLYAADVLGLDVEAIGLIMSASSAVDMSLFYPAGLLMDRLGRKFAIVPSFALQAVGMALVPFTASLGGLLSAAILIGLGNGLGSGAMLITGADLAPQRGRGEFLGIWQLIGDAGTSGGPLVVGAIADLLVLSSAAWALSAAGLLASAIFVLLVPETLKRPARPAQLALEPRIVKRNADD